MAIININIPSQLPILTGNSLLYLRVNVAENGIEWAATAGGGITIGTTAITSGTVGRVIFEGAGNVLQQNANFIWDNTNSRLGIREPSPDSSVVIRGADTGNSTFALKVHNSTGISNAFVVRDDGRIGFGTNTLNEYVNILKDSTLTLCEISNNTLLTTSLTGSGLKLTHRGESALIFYKNTLEANESNKALRFQSDRGYNFLALGKLGIGNKYYNFDMLAFGNSVSFDDGAEGFVNGTSNTRIALLNSAGNSRTQITLGLNSILSVRSTSGSLRHLATFIDGAEATRITNALNVLIGTTTDVATSILTLNSTTKGFLPPRMTTAQRDAIVTPATGLMIYNTTTNRPNFYDGTNWVAL